METIIEFTCARDYASVSGWMNLEDCDTEDCLNFYNEGGFEIGTQFPKNPFPEYDAGIKVVNYEDFETLKEAMLSDELLIQFLVDFANEKKTVDRENYTLYINGGE